MAIVVDMRKATNNSVYIHDKDKEYVDMVGLDFKGDLVIVPWKTGLQFICYGPCPIAAVTSEEVVAG